MDCIILNYSSYYSYLYGKITVCRPQFHVFLYVLSGCSTEEESVVYYGEAKIILSEANFNLRSWASNSKQLRHSTKKDEVADSSEPVNTLGLVWYTTDDTMSLALCQYL